MSYIIVVVLVIFGLAGIRIADQYVRGVVFRLGRYHTTKGPGLYWIIPLIEWQRRVDLRINTAAVEQQETITKDNVPIKVNAVVWYRIVNPMASVLEVKNIDTAVIQVALTTLRTGIGQHSLDEVLKEQEAVANVIQGKIDAVTEPWGVKVERVEMKNVEIPQSMQRVMAQEAEALREKRARIIKAQAEFEAAEQLRKASEIIMQNPAGLELRRMQMITEVGAEQNTMTIIMMPSEFVAMAKNLGGLGKPSASQVARAHCSPLIPAKAGIQRSARKLGPRLRGDERMVQPIYGSSRTGSPALAMKVLASRTENSPK